MSSMPFVQIREFGDDAKLLAGGRIWFYEKGTTTPKPTWQDADLTVLNTNPVPLSASGSAKIHVDGAYSYKIERYASGGYILQEQGDFVTEGGGSGLLSVYENYAALAASTLGEDAAIVIDGFNAGDRAGGLFLRNNALTYDTTDGVVVVGFSKYERVYSGSIAAEWCGVEASGTAQASAVNRATGTSVRYGRPVAFDLPFQVESAITIPAGAAIQYGEQCTISGATVLNWTHALGSQVVSIGAGTFGPNIRPKFDTRLAGPLRLSWCTGATDDETLAQFLGMPVGTGYVLAIDKPLNDVRTNFVLPTGNTLRHEAGRILFTTGALSITVGAWETPARRPVFQFSAASNINGVSIPEPARPEWFGAVGDGVANDTIPLAACFWAGAVQCAGEYVHNLAGQNYATVYIFSDYPLYQPGSSVIRKTSISFLQTPTFANLWLYDAFLIAPASQSAATVTGTLTMLRSAIGNSSTETVATAARLFAFDSFLQVRGQVVASVATAVSNMTYVTTSATDRETEATAVSVRNLRLPAVLNAKGLRTDAEGDITSQPGPLMYAGAVWDLVADFNINPMRIKYVNGLWFCLGAGGAYATSADTEAWTSYAIGDTDATLQDVVYDGSHYVAIGYKTSASYVIYAWYSTNATSWTKVTIPRTAASNMHPRNAAVMGGKIYIYEWLWTYAVSSDHGATWTSGIIDNTAGAGSFPAEDSRGFVGVVNGELWFADGYGNFYHSPNPGVVAFQPAATESFATAKYGVHVSYSGGRYRFVMSNGSAFSAATLPYSSPIIDISDYTVASQVTDVTEMNGARILTVGEIYGNAYGDGYVVTNLNGLAWTRRVAAIQASQFRSVGAGDGVYLAVNSSGSVYRAI